MRLSEIETARLRLRPYVAGDLDALHALWVDPDVRRYLWDDEIIARELAATTMQESIAYFDARGFGQWAVRLSASPALIGFCGYRLTEPGTNVELLYGLAPAHRHRGLATEAARAVLRYGFETLEFPRVLAATDAPNVESIRVLERLGMRYEKRAPMNDRDSLHYVLAREDFQPSASTDRVRLI